MLTVNLEKILDDEDACRKFRDELVSRLKQIDQK